MTPRFHRWMLRITAAADERAELIHDLEDEMRARAERDGDAAARRWYRRQVRRSVGPLLRRRYTRPNAGRPSGVGAGLDLRVALRSLARAPVFALSTVLLLGLGIGAFTVVYAVVDAQAVRAMPFGDRNDRLVSVHSVHPTLTDPHDVEDAAVSFADYRDMREVATTLEGLEAAMGRSIAVSFGNDTRRALAASITPGMFSMLGVTPRLGRDFRPEEAAEPGFESAVIVGHALWRDLLGGDERAVGGTVRLNDRAVTVVGVMPPAFAFPEEHELWLPYGTEDQLPRQNRSWLAIGLLRPGITLEEAAVELRGIAARIELDHPATNQDWSVALLPIRDLLIGSVADEARMLAAVTLLLLVACANVAGLFIARGVTRQTELVVRMALGSGRGRLVRWLASEAVVIAALGGGLGLLLGSWEIRALIDWMPERPPYWALPELDARVTGVVAGATALVALLAGVLPAVRLSRIRPSDVLATGLRAAGTAGHRRAQHLLVVTQVSLTFALVVGALLLARSATALLQADAGFDHRPLLSGRFYMAGDRYDSVDARTALVDTIVTRLAALPGVRGVAATGAIPSDDGGDEVRLLPPGAGADGRESIGAQLVPVTAGFWETLDLPLTEGRTFTTSESIDPATDAIVINRRLAERFWPGGRAVGRTVRLMDGADVLPLRVVGVAPDLVYEELTEETPQSQLNVYVPYVHAGWRTQALLVHVGVEDPGALAQAVRAEIRAVDPGLAVYDVQSMIDRRQYNHWGDHFMGRTMTILAAAALLLACIGAYGIASQAVAARRREIGVRIAIGASTGDIRALFLGAGVRLGLLGSAAGLPLAFATASALERELFRVSPWQTWIWVGLPVLLIGSLVLATYWPARRASRMDPARMLREG